MSNLQGEQKNIYSAHAITKTYYNTPIYLNGGKRYDCNASIKAAFKTGQYIYIPFKKKRIHILR